MHTWADKLEVIPYLFGLFEGPCIPLTCSILWRRQLPGFEGGLMSPVGAWRSSRILEVDLLVPSSDPFQKIPIQ